MVGEKGLLERESLNNFEFVIILNYYIVKR